ncbi:hypothetical protein [Methanoregula sp.]|uniref:hypothetical protein n=1 Tax=Methanoregula sp. TaxID=2052170 RepID=UPI00236E5C9D|nr:hypothetical protein [Methanoregula sp.]MDD1686196.1 hypothetical protein [Methanoregula sp.]
MSGKLEKNTAVFSNLPLKRPGVLCRFQNHMRAGVHYSPGREQQEMIVRERPGKNLHSQYWHVP